MPGRDLAGSEIRYNKYTILHAYFLHWKRERESAGLSLSFLLGLLAFIVHPTPKER